MFLLCLYRRLRYGYPFRRIRLTQGKYAIVDPEDYLRLAGYKWYAVKKRYNFYAVRKQSFLKSRRTISMHHCVLKLPPHLIIDHINNNGLDNRKANLRLATHTQNARNRLKTKSITTSAYKGVTFCLYHKKFRAAVYADGRKIHLGYFRNEIDAARAYDRAARQYHGEFAATNFAD